MNDWVDAEEEMSSEFWYDRPKMIGNKNGWKPELDKLYEEAKKLVADGVNVSCACEAVGLTREQYYRRRRIEIHGRDRV